MLSDLSLIDCESVASEGKLKYKQASVQIQEFTETHFEFPDSIPDLSLLIRRVSCGHYKVRERLMLLHSFQDPIAIVLEFLHGRRLGIALPLADEDIELLDDMDRLIWDMVRAYNMLIVETSASYRCAVSYSLSTQAMIVSATSRHPDSSIMSCPMPANMTGSVP